MASSGLTSISLRPTPARTKIHGIVYLLILIFKYFQSLNSITNSTRLCAFHLKQTARITQNTFISTNSHLSSQRLPSPLTVRLSIETLGQAQGIPQEPLFSFAGVRRLMGSTSKDPLHHQGCGPGSHELLVLASQFSLLSHVTNGGPRHIILRVVAE